MGLREYFGFAPKMERREEVGGPEEPSPPSPMQVAPPSRVPTSRNPLSLSMVYRAIGIHAIAAKQMRLQHWKENIADPWGNDHRLPLGSFLRRPDINTNRSAFVEQTVVSLACRGNAYWRRVMDSQGRIMNLEVLNPLQMNIVRNDGVLEYWYAGNRKPYSEAEIKHLKLLRVPGTEYGLGPIQAAMIEIDGALDARDYSSNWFADSPQPTGVLKSDQPLNNEQAASAKQRYQETQGGKRGVLVLGYGLDYSPIFLSPKDIQFLETQQFNTVQIARLFGVPASLMLAVLEGNSQTYANVDQDWLGFVRFSSMQYLIEIEDALSDVMPRFEYAKFDVDGLLRSDITTRFSAYKVATGGKAWMLPSEVRATENMKPASGIDDQPAPAPDPQGGANDAAVQ